MGEVFVVERIELEDGRTYDKITVVVEPNYVKLNYKDMNKDSVEKMNELVPWHRVKRILLEL